MQNVFDEYYFKYDFDDNPLISKNYTEKDYFKDKIIELREVIKEGRLRIDVPDVDATYGTQYDIGKEVLDDYFTTFDRDDELNMEYINKTVTDENAKRLFDSIFSKILDPLIEKVKEAFKALSNDEANNLSSDEKKNYVIFTQKAKEYESLAIDTHIDEQYTTEKLDLIYSAEQFIKSNKDRNLSEWTCPNMNAILSVDSSKGWLINQAAKENINLPDLVEAAGSNIKDIDYGDLSEVYGRAIDYKRQTGKDKISYGSFKDIVEHMYNNPKGFTSNMIHKINNAYNRMQQAIQQPKTTYVQYTMSDKPQTLEQEIQSYRKKNNQQSLQLGQNQQTKNTGLGRE